jgi:hypothetical protein
VKGKVSLESKKRKKGHEREEGGAIGLVRRERRNES